MDDKAFRTLVRRALAGLPPEFRRAVKNMEIVVEEEPARRHEALFGKRGEKRLLLGLYEGVPLTERASDYGGVLPDKITLFKESIRSYCGGDTEKMAEEIRRTFLHELGHHFGLSDKRLRELGY